MGRRAATFTLDEINRAVRAAEKIGWVVEIEPNKLRLVPKEAKNEPFVQPQAVAKNANFSF